MRRFAKPLYWLIPVPRVRIPPSPPDSLGFREIRQHSFEKRHNCAGLTRKPHRTKVSRRNLRAAFAAFSLSQHPKDGGEPLRFGVHTCLANYNRFRRRSRRNWKRPGLRAWQRWIRSWTPYRASLFCVRWQGFLLGGGPETEACCTRKARAVAAHHGIATNCTHNRRVPRRLGTALVHPGAWESEADSEVSPPGTCPGHPSAPSEISAVCSSNASRRRTRHPDHSGADHFLG